MTEQERLEKAVVDTEAAFDAAPVVDAWDAWFKARLELADYLKEQDK
jgi:hypothetical protein